MNALQPGTNNGRRAQALLNAEAANRTRKNAAAVEAAAADPAETFVAAAPPTEEDLTNLFRHRPRKNSPKQADLNALFSHVKELNPNLRTNNFGMLPEPLVQVPVQPIAPIQNDFYNKMSSGKPRPFNAIRKTMKNRLANKKVWAPTTVIPKIPAETPEPVKKETENLWWRQYPMNFHLQRKEKSIGRYNNNTKAHYNHDLPDFLRNYRASKKVRSK